MNPQNELKRLEDITGLKETRALPAEAEDSVRAMIDALPVSITIWDRAYNILDCSQYAVDLLGFSSKRELLQRLVRCVPEYQPCGKRSMDLLAESSAEAFAAGHHRLEWVHLTAGGEPILLDVNAIRIRFKGDDALLLYARDIREEKKMLEELARRDEMRVEQAHWYKSLLNGIPLPISVTDMAMNLVFTNTAFENICGKSHEELMGQPCSIWNRPMCGTAECSIVRAKQGQKQSFFKQNDSSFQVDTEIIRNLAGEPRGYLEVFHDITEIENMARRQAETASEAKSVFLAQMSHEIRTPLSAVLGLSELMLENGGLSQDNATYLDRIYSAGFTLLGIVNDILDLSKIEAGKFEILRHTYDVPTLINDVVTQNILRIRSKPINFSLHINENAPARLYGDELRVKQILSNLLSNAFKYTEEGSVELRLDYEREGDSVWMTCRVSDTGIGIRPEDLQRLFTDYTRLDTTSTQKTDGTGLGLSITKKLVELMDGVVSVESEFGQGSVFTAKMRQRSAGDAVIGKEMVEYVGNFRHTASRHRQLKRVSLPYARVLVVDDNQTNLDIALGLMKPYGMDIDCVTSGQAAIDAVREEKKKYSAIFMDHMMPGMDGLEAVRIIREEIGSEYARTVPIIALTANAIAGSKERFLSKGFNSFVSKPIDLYRLDTVIRRWIKDPGPPSSPGTDRRQTQDRRTKRDRRKNPDRRVADRRNSSAPRPVPGTIAGVDHIRGLELFGSEESFHQVLRSYAVNTRPLLETIAEVSGQTLTQYAVTVHGLKSSSRGVCAQRLGDLAESLESAAKAGNLDFVSRHNPDFRQAARTLIGEIEAWLEATAQTGAKPQKSEPDGPALARLGAACGRYDMDEIDAAMREIEGYAYTDDHGLAAWLREAVTQLNYKQIIEKIQPLVKEV